MTVDVSADGHDEFLQIAEDATAQPILSQSDASWFWIFSLLP
jgi:hypothetical protein